MGKKGDDRRDKILCVAEHLILKKGFAGTSIDEILKTAHITKGGFFYHFNGKSDLARSLLQRYLDQDEQFFRQLFERADTLSEDPLQQMLIFMNLLAEAMADLPDVHPGCLVATVAYENQQFDDAIKELAAEGVISWRKMFAERLENIAREYPLKLDISITDLADNLSTTIEGGITLSRVLNDQQILVKQLHQHRSYLRLLFGDV